MKLTLTDDDGVVLATLDVDPRDVVIVTRNGDLQYH